MIATLKQLNTDRSSLDELVALSVGAKQLRSEYEANMLPVPAWLSGALKAISTEISMKRRDSLEKRRAEILAQQAGLESAQEKRERLARELEELESALAPAAV